ncbi:unnamed protein product [Euphydryas editha]|uniref:Uncharacterized protein n=1 Tax=Euphydryas editha TaxID=104508 RepID=A0AAU9UVH9_EUPED|nr:unnamed protein product [Euphydryas editha]
MGFREETEKLLVEDLKISKQDAILIIARREVEGLISYPNAKGKLMECIDAIENEFVEYQAAIDAMNDSRHIDIEARTDVTLGALTTMLDEQSTKFDEHAKNVEGKLQALQEQLAQHSGGVATLLRTYAAAAAAKPKGPGKPAAIHSIVVTSKEPTDSGEAVMGKIRDIVRAMESGIKVERIWKAKDQKVVMGFITEEERDKAKKKLAGERKGLAVEILKNRDPLEVLKGVSKDIGDEEVVRALRNQNGELFGGLDLEDDRLSIKYRKQTRSQYTTQVVLSTSPALWKRITEAGKVYEVHVQCSVTHNSEKIRDH